MVTKTVSWIAPMVEADDRGNHYITVKFLDGDTAYIGKKDLDAAIEVRGLLEETVDLERDFTLEDTGKQTKDGHTRWKIKAFGPYQPAQYVPGGNGTAPSSEPPAPRSVEEDQFRYQERVDRRHAAELATFEGAFDPFAAEVIYTFLRKTSGSVEPSTLPEGSVVRQDTTSPTDPETTSVSADDRGGQGETDATASGLGEASCPPHQLNLDVAAKAGRYPCRKCGAYVNPRASYTE